MVPENVVHLFGIRHHGPGSARSLLRALEALKPDCVLIEGPPEADAIIPFAMDAAMVPPVAMLVHCPEEPNLAVFYPMAEFSPEWQAMRWALAANVPVRFMDLPQAHSLAIQKQRDKTPAPEEPETETETVAADAGPAEPQPEPESESEEHTDPLGWLAQAAGYADGESWWNHMVEERGDGEDIFVAIAEAMTEIRREAPPATGPRGEREALREAWMRTTIREARKQGHERIAVVCGAWHVPAIDIEADGARTAKADAQLLKGMPKLKVSATWAPWTYRHLTMASGYGAGVASPGWYDFLWKQGNGGVRASAWLARVARLLRQEDLDCSSAHVIEGTRLAETLAALRERPAPALAELNEACVTVLCHGESAPLKLIENRLSVGNVLGAVPETVPAVPLQRDLEQQQKSLRLKPEALARTLELDLRKETDLARSRLLHRLGLLEIDWGKLAKTGQSRGTFREVWDLSWEPGFAVTIIGASRWGSTVEDAAVAKAIDKTRSIESLPALAKLMDQVLLADLAAAVAPVTHELEARAAVTGDVAQLLSALPALANVFRYGSVRRTDGELVGHLIDGIILRASLSLPMACTSLDEAAANELRTLVLDADRAIALRDSQEQTTAWRQALRQLAHTESAQALLRGLAARLLLVAGLLEGDEAAALFSRQLSSGVDPSSSASWIDGFLNRNAVVLMHDGKVLQLLDNWLAGLTDEHFLSVLPLVRRTFAAFAAAERRDLSERLKRRTDAAPAKVATPQWDETRAALPVPLLKQIFGIDS